MSEQTSAEQKHVDIVGDLPEGSALRNQLLEELGAFDATVRKVEERYGEAYSRLRELEQKLVSQQEDWLGR